MVMKLEKWPLSNTIQYEEMIFQRVCDKAIFGFPNLLGKKIILQILASEFLALNMGIQA